MALIPFSDGVTERVYEAVMVHTKDKADEWMYELKAQESEQAKDADFVLGVRALFGGGNPSSARQYFNSHLQIHPNDAASKWYVDHILDITHSMHENWGFMVPVNILCTATTKKKPSHGNTNAAQE
jgi:hypothetical protein